MKRIIYVLIAVGIFISISIFTFHSLQLGDPPPNQVHRQSWEVSGSQLKHLKIDSDYEIAVQFTPSKDGKDHVDLEGRLPEQLIQQLHPVTIQNGSLELNLQIEKDKWQLVQPHIIPKVQYINVQLANMKSLESAEFKLKSTQMNLNHIAAKQINIQSTSGRIKAKQLYGETTVHTSSGNIEIQHWQGKTLHVQTASGNTNIQSAQGSLLSNLSSGDLEVDHLNGTAAITSRSGNINLHLNQPDKVQINTETGHVSLQSDPTFPVTYDLKSATGRISAPTTVNSKKAVIQINTDSGNISVQ